MNFEEILLESGWLSPAELEKSKQDHQLWTAQNYQLSFSDYLIVQNKITPQQVRVILSEIQQQNLPARIGNFQIIEFLGQGAMGSVYKGIREKTLAAVKIMREIYSSDRIMTMRFLREIEILKTVSHPNILKIYEFGKDAALNAHYVALEFVEGMNMEEWMAFYGSLQIDYALEIIISVAKAIDYASTINLVHRDIKPGNILLGGDGAVKVADFGLAKRMDSEQITQTGIILGTPYYISPEQVLGAKEITSQSDIYSLGITLFHMLTGKPPFREGETTKILIQHVLDPLPNVGKIRVDVPEDVRELLEKMTLKNPLERSSPSEVMMRAGEILARLKKNQELYESKVDYHLQRLLSKNKNIPQKSAASTEAPLSSANARSRPMLLPSFLQDGASDLKQLAGEKKTSRRVTRNLSTSDLPVPAGEAHAQETQGIELPPIPADLLEKATHAQETQSIELPPIPAGPLGKATHVQATHAQETQSIELPPIPAGPLGKATHVQETHVQETQSIELPPIPAGLLGEDEEHKPGISDLPEEPQKKDAEGQIKPYEIDIASLPLKIAPFEEDPTKTWGSDSSSFRMLSLDQFKMGNKTRAMDRPVVPNSSDETGIMEGDEVLEVVQDIRGRDNPEVAPCSGPAAPPDSSDLSETPFQEEKDQPEPVLPVLPVSPEELVCSPPNRHPELDEKPSGDTTKDKPSRSNPSQGASPAPSNLKFSPIKSGEKQAQKAMKPAQKQMMLYLIAGEIIFILIILTIVAVVLLG